MKKLIVGIIVVLVLGFSWFNQVGTPVEEEPVVQQEVNPVEEALKKFKHVDIVNTTVTDSHVTVVLELSPSIGAGTQVSNVTQRSKDVREAMPNDIETMTVGVMYDDIRVLQFTENVKTGERVIEKVVPEVEQFIRHE